MLVKVTLSVCLNYMQTNCAYMGSHSPKAHSELGKHLLKHMYHQLVILFTYRKLKKFERQNSSRGKSYAFHNDYMKTANIFIVLFQYEHQN